MLVELRSLESLKPYPANPRKHGPRLIASLAGAIKDYGFRVPVILAPDGTIVCGHARVEAARQLGMESVPCHVADDLSDEKLRAFRVAENQLCRIAEWEPELLADELRELEALNVDIKSLGFDDEELAQWLPQEPVAGLVDPDAIPEPPAEATTKPGDLWLLGDHRLLCGDSGHEAHVDALLNGAPIHVCNSDPPYNVKVEPRSDRALAAGNKGMPGGGQYEKIRKGTLGRQQLRPKDRHLKNDFENDEAFDQTMRRVFGNVARVLMPGRAFYVWCGAFPSNAGGPANTESFPQIFRSVGLRYAQMLVWNKGHGILGRKDFMTQYEVCLYGWRDGAAHQWFGPNNVTDLWDVKRVLQAQMIHLTEKPVELAQRAIQYSSKPGENVLDLFGGSGSTLIAAEQNQRRAYLMELDPLYADVIVQRWETFTGKKAERRSGAVEVAARSPHSETAPASAEAGGDE